MTLVAGIVPRPGGPSIPSEIERSLIEEISRDPTHAPEVVRRGASLLLKVDLGAFPSPALIDEPQGPATAVCGEPLLLGQDHRAWRPREVDVAELHRSAARGAWLETLPSATGTFAAAHLSANGQQLLLASDSLGVRPLYLWEGHHGVIFSSTLRLLLALPGLRRSLDLLGALEFAVKRTPLGARTPYREIRRIGPAEVMTYAADSGAFRIHRYRDLPGGKKAGSGAPDSREFQRTLLDRFEEAIARRLRGDQATLAFLSGGMDSRAIVALLRDLGAEVHTFNFSIPGQQDEVYAREFAKAVGTLHRTEARRKPVSLWAGDWSRMLAQAWNDPSRRENPGVERPRIAWSGDGGSVSVGGSAAHRDEIALAMSRGNLDEAARLYLPRLPRRILRRPVREELEALLHEGMVRELERLAVDDPLRTFHLFLMLNDQRRHLDGHFEEIDRHGLELQLPFFDAAFQSLLAEIPIHALRKHAFYNAWYDCFPPAVRAVPWQAYPGHRPCPTPARAQISDQWSRAGGKGAAVVERAGYRLERRQILELLHGRGFPSTHLSRSAVLLAGLLSQLRLRRTGHAVEFAWWMTRVSSGEASGGAWG